MEALHKLFHNDDVSALDDKYTGNELCKIGVQWQEFLDTAFFKSPEIGF
jgi:hypothetical protein